MDGLPKLPGLDFENKLKLKHHLPHSMGYRNGFRMSNKPPCGIGGYPLKEDSVAYVESSDSVMYDPILTYGRVKHPPVAPFRPHYVIYDKKVLKFMGFFKQCCADSPKEYYRIRYVNIFYFLEDDSLTVIETPHEGKVARLIKRGKIVKNSKGQFYTWKDLNVGIDIELQGIVFHTVECDPFTNEFLLSNGIELNEKECMPTDPFYTQKLIDKPKITRVSPQVDDKLRKYLEFTGKVLHFDCVLDETDRPGGELLTYKLFYYLEDDTIAVKELKENREGRDHFPMLLKRTKLPKTWTRRPVDYAAIVFERCDNEVTEYYQPVDLEVGGTVFVYGRRFLLLDCDAFTRKYYREVLRKPQGNKLEVQLPQPGKPTPKIPIYLGLGSPEDSLSSCYGLRPKPPRKDVVTYLVNANKSLRYECELDSAHPEDKIRRFIISLSLADGSIKIKEKNIENSGIKGGGFLSSRKVPRAGCNPNKPEYLGPKDFWIGATVPIYAHRFKITGADLYVYRYMQTHPEQFTSEIIETLKTYHLLQGNLKDDFKNATIDDCEEYKRQQKFDEANRKDPTFMERCLKEVNMFEGGNELTMKELKDEVRKPNFHGDRTECPYPIIPENLIKNTYHSNRGEDQKFFVDPCAEAPQYGDDQYQTENAPQLGKQSNCPEKCIRSDGGLEPKC